MNRFEVSLSCAIRAYAFSHIVYSLNLIAGRVAYLWYGHVFKTECAVTNFTMEMNMTVIISVTLGVTQLVANAFTAVFNLMQEMALLEKGERAEYTGLVNGINSVFKFSHSDWPMKISQRLEYQQPVGCGLYSVL